MRYGTIVTLVLALVLSGCVTKPPRPDQIRLVPTERLLGLQQKHAGDGTLVVTRDVGFSGSGCLGAVFVDGVEVAKLATGERASFYVAAGEHVVGTWNTGSGLCGYREGKDRRETSAVVKEGEAKRFRITINPGSGVEINPTTLD